MLLRVLLGLLVVGGVAAVAKAASRKPRVAQRGASNNTWFLEEKPRGTFSVFTSNDDRFAILRFSVGADGVRRAAFVEPGSFALAKTAMADLAVVGPV